MRSGFGILMIPAATIFNMIWVQDKVWNLVWDEVYCKVWHLVSDELSVALSLELTQQIPHVFSDQIFHQIHDDEL